MAWTHVERKDDADYVKARSGLVVEWMVLWQAEEHMAEHSVCRHTTAESLPT